MLTTSLLNTEYDEYYQRYIDNVSKDLTLMEALEKGRENVINFFERIPKEKQEYKYAEDKWTIKEVLQHLIDTERIFSYRFFRIGRRDTTSLAGFEQDDYIQPSRANEKSMQELISEFKITRAYSLSILESLRNDDLLFVGKANMSPVSARAAAFIIPGHDIWHMKIIKERYL